MGKFSPCFYRSINICSLAGKPIKKRLFVARHIYVPSVISRWERLQMFFVLKERNRFRSDNDRKNRGLFCGALYSRTCTKVYIK